MVFSSVPSYLDPPNWPPQQSAGAVSSGHDDAYHGIAQLPPPLFPPPPPVGSGGDFTGMGRPAGLMSERARMAKLPQPEAAMKCPRCESTNTKFCYFNNYSLSQPRHFCKTCRRYWTRGGALRNVPVGGGCRRNKKSSKGSRSSRSKSPATTSSTSNTSVISPNRCPTDVLGHFAHSSQPSQFPIFPSLHHLDNQYGGGDIGLNFGGGNGIELTQTGHHKLAQFPFLEAANGTGMYQFDGVEGSSSYGGEQFGSKVMVSRGLKLEENHPHHQQGVLNLSKNFLGITGNEQFLGTSHVAWSTTDLSRFPSSSTTTTTHIL